MQECFGVPTTVLMLDQCPLSFPNTDRSSYHMVTISSPRGPRRYVSYSQYYGSSGHIKGGHRIRYGLDYGSDYLTASTAETVDHASDYWGATKDSAVMDSLDRRSSRSRVSYHHDCLLAHPVDSEHNSVRSNLVEEVALQTKVAQESSALPAQIDRRTAKASVSASWG